jgi:hypothetical protein
MITDNMRVMGIEGIHCDGWFPNHFVGRLSLEHPFAQLQRLYNKTIYIKCDVVLI